MASVANAYVRAAAAHYKHMRDLPPSHFNFKVTCSLHGRQTRWFAPPDVVSTTLFGKCGCCPMNNITNGIICHTKAKICGVEFTAGHNVDGGTRGTCGSVFTCVIDEQSLYGRVIKFFSHTCDAQKDLYAYVSWFNKPDYPFEGTPLVVRVKDDAQPVQSSTVISIFDIDPSRVIIERSDKEGCFYMCRIEGLDTITL